jgi:hypothetical protein
MKISINMFKPISLFIAAGVLFISQAMAQNNGILPLTGLKYFKEGIWAKSVDVKVDGALLISNRLPLNKEIEIALQEPSGFAEDRNKTVFAAAELVIVSVRGDVLFKNPNIFIKNETSGFAAKDIKTLSIKFGVPADAMKSNMNGGIVKIRLYDLKSKSQLRLELPITLITKPGEMAQVSKGVKTMKLPDGCVGMITGLKAKNMLVAVDTSIKVSPKMAYTSLDISAIEGSSISGIFSGRENFWVYDNNLNEVKITDILLKQVKGAMENSNVDYTLKIPYKLKNNPAKQAYTVRFRWESQDKKQVIDVVMNI